MPATNRCVLLLLLVSLRRPTRRKKQPTNQLFALIRIIIVITLCVCSRRVVVVCTANQAKHTVHSSSIIDVPTIYYDRFAIKYTKSLSQSLACRSKSLIVILNRKSNISIANNGIMIQSASSIVAPLPANDKAPLEEDNEKTPATDTSFNCMTDAETPNVECSSPLASSKKQQNKHSEEDMYSPTTNAAHILAMVGNSSWASQTLAKPLPLGMASFSPARKRASTIAISSDGLGLGGGCGGNQPYFDGSGMYPMQQNMRALSWLANMKDDEADAVGSLFALSNAAVPSGGSGSMGGLIGGFSSSLSPTAAMSGMKRSSSEKDLMASLAAMREMSMPWTFDDDRGNNAPSGKKKAAPGSSSSSSRSRKSRSGSLSGAANSGNGSNLKKKRTKSELEAAGDDDSPTSRFVTMGILPASSNAGGGGKADANKRRQRSRSLPFLARGVSDETEGGGSTGRLGAGVLTGNGSNSSTAARAAGMAAAAALAAANRVRGDSKSSNTNSDDGSNDEEDDEGYSSTSPGGKYPVKAGSRGHRGKEGSGGNEQEEEEDERETSGSSLLSNPLVAAGCSGYKQKDDPLSLALRKYHYLGARKNIAGYIGIYAPEDRKIRIARFLEKRQHRVWAKKVKYDVRKNFADSRVRVKGRFVKKEEMAKMGLNVDGTPLVKDAADEEERGVKEDIISNSPVAVESPSTTTAASSE